MIQDLKHAWRTFLRMPGFTAVAVLTLAVGIGANTAIFSVVYALLLKPLPFRNPEQLIYVHDTYPAVSLASVAWQKFVALRDGNRTLEALGAFTLGTATMTGRGEPQQIPVARVSGDFFRVLGVGPLRGRWIAPEDDLPNVNPVIVLGHGIWQQSFGGDPTLIGRTIIADGQPRTVVAVMPPGFGYPTRVDAWIPLAVSAPNPGNNFLRLVGRVKPGITLAQATDDLRRITASYNALHNFRRDVRVYSLHGFLAAGNRQMLLVLQGAVLLVLLVSCANVANMLLARSIVRRRELAVRMTMGASLSRLVRQLLAESTLLAVASAATGILLAHWLLQLFLGLAPAGYSGVQSIAIDRHVLGFTVLLAVLTGIVFGVAPTAGFRLDAGDALRDAGGRSATSGRSRGIGRVLVIAEIGLAIVLVVGAALMVKSLLALQAQDAGFRPDRLLTFQINLPSARYAGAGARRAMSQILDNVRTAPGVTAAGAINFLPLSQFGFNGPFTIPGRPPVSEIDRAPVVEFRMVTPGYFAAMSIPVRLGRDLDERDDERERPVVLINETMARQFWPGGSPIGARLQLGMDVTGAAREIVGVVGDVRSAALNRSPVPEVYVPYAQVPSAGMSVAVRTTLDPAGLLPQIRARIAAVDPDLPIVRPQSMNDVVEASAGSMRLSSMMTSMFAVAAALLATVGIYGLMAYSVAQRTREIGIRVALGADPAAVLRMIVGEGLVLAAFGLAVGLAGAGALTGTLRAMLFAVSPSDPVVLIGTCLAVLLVTVAASLVPASRVMRIDPTIALRAE